MNRVLLFNIIPHGLIRTKTLTFSYSFNVVFNTRILKVEILIYQKNYGKFNPYF